ncbi:cytochrome c oxidase assembly protein [Ottowia beijingensis]|uniref:cytochrome c oxidase assembly protein n=1 Tax=Ottowia beijingensis TaxID=1207057 RepID=UPI0028049EAD|nr:cytochrome c oxidase assembly protein [Ottowia beijingensis]
MRAQRHAVFGARAAPPAAGGRGGALLALAAGPARAGQRRARSPAGAALVFGLVLWLWHAPQAYAWGLTSVAGYWLMQASLLRTAWWFWRAVLRSDQPWGGAVLALFATVAHMGLLGALIVFAGQLLYPVHVAGTLAWGAAPLADQQLGGLLMWVPAIVPFMAAALWRLAQGLRRAEAAA